MAEPEAAEEAEGAAPAIDTAIYEQIRELSTQLKFISRQGAPILHLPESTDQS
jgi:hypothetical protein